MPSIAFIDAEIDPKRKTVLEIGGVKDSGAVYHGADLVGFRRFLDGVPYVAGHNILEHDIKYLGNQTGARLIDTLPLSPLLFPIKPYHALLKDDKLQTDETNNPLNDAMKARDLFFDEVAAYGRLDEAMKLVLFGLLVSQPTFQAFFQFVGVGPTSNAGPTSGAELSSGVGPSASNLEHLIRQRFETALCSHADVGTMLQAQPVALAYALSLINALERRNDVRSITPPWVLHKHPEVERILYALRNKPCLPGCPYCNKALDIHKGLLRFFGFEAFRTYGGEPLQEKAAQAAVDNRSLLAIFPTGGGKSLTFQLPALMSGENVRGLTVVISPLQSLMKDQVDNLEKAGITDAVTINGLLDPIERAKAMERVNNGSASLLYIAPESLRSRTMERLLLGRKLVRFVIDEAHCFSAWGQDFRVDYLYIGDFIRRMQTLKQLSDPIPVSCFTATARLSVIADIRQYFRDKLGLELDLFTANATRTNLRYAVTALNDEEEKYQTVRALIEAKRCSSILYVSRTHKADVLAQRLCQDGIQARPFHGKMDTNDKTANQNAFLAGEVPVMVATSAFGMGVDKKDVGLVVHYEIADSLENYVQEAGRAGRDEAITADCHVLFNEEDLSKHFILLNQTKLSIKEIRQVWKAIKELTHFRSTVSYSALEIARKAGWDDGVMDIETRLKTAVAALENAGYLRRGQNIPHVYANSILTKNAQEAIDKIRSSPRFSEREQVNATRIIKKLFSVKSRRHTNDETPESRIDYISDQLGLEKETVIHLINLLREERILADSKDLTAFIKRGEAKNRPLKVLEAFRAMETALLPLLTEEEQTFNLKDLNESFAEQGCPDVSVPRLKTLLTIWAIKQWVRRSNLPYSNNHVALQALDQQASLRNKLEKRHELARFIVELLYERSVKEALKETTKETSKEPPKDTAEDILVEFSVKELKTAFEASQRLFFNQAISMDDVEDALFYLSRIEAIKLEGGFLVLYNSLTIERLETDNRKQYTKEDYETLNRFYENKVQQIHIVGEYATKMVEDYKAALQFVEDYFRLNYTTFLGKYFPGKKAETLSLKMTPAKFKQLFGTLTPAQLAIINDNTSKHIVVAAGPGSGKTKVLVHKLASLVLMEDVKHEQLLMLTFSRAAATEFKKRLLSLIGHAANFIEIKTFHAYCFDLLGRVGSLEKSDDILKTTVELIRHREVEASRITKTVLVIDEAQDMNADEFELVKALMEHNDDMRVIAVGDDDQNIFEFRGASAVYLEQFIHNYQATKYELVENFRSRQNLVAFTNLFVQRLRHRLKHTPIMARQTENGRLTIVRHSSPHLLTPLVEDIVASSRYGTTAVLTRTNDEALQVTGLLRHYGLPARLVQTNDGFSLTNLAEFRYFLEQLARFSGSSNDHTTPQRLQVITDETWQRARRALNHQYSCSDKIDLCNALLHDFEAANPNRKYASDLDVFLRESNLEDAFHHPVDSLNSGGAIHCPEASLHAAGDSFHAAGGSLFAPDTSLLVSTIHRAKGKEFDSVFLLLNDYTPTTDEANRLIYVAMTRAKRNLSIHLNTDFLDTLKTPSVEFILDNTPYEPAPELTLHLTHKDVWLDFFSHRQRILSTLMSGQSLTYDGESCLNNNGQTVLRFSQHFLKQLATLQANGYTLATVTINVVVYWKKEGDEKAIRIVLPECGFKRELL
ncbi:MAG: RecQ family ATP-dependent DNA helicase [Bacteroidales bacterium]|nr:RecQ family ATP-dependent DNA helicase [Bacteroidales bacterium]